MLGLDNGVVVVTRIRVENFGMLLLPKFGFDSRNDPKRALVEDT